MDHPLPERRIIMSTSAVEVSSPLQCGFSFWYMRRGKGTSAAPSTTSEEPSTDSASVDPNTSAATAHLYENAVKHIATVDSVEDFWSVYDHLVRPNKVTHNTTTTFHFFRAGIKPTWEDPYNTHGGQWVIRLRKGLASRYWEELLLALIGSQFVNLPDGEVCGAVISVRYTEDILGVWNKTASDPEIIDRVRETIKRILQLPNFVHMEYKPHETSLFGDKMNASSPPTFVQSNAATGSGHVNAYRSGAMGHHAGKGVSMIGDRDELRGASLYTRPTTKRDSDRSWR